jgi:hypothetical protein
LIKIHTILKRIVRNLNIILKKILKNIKKIVSNKTSELLHLYMSLKSSINEKPLHNCQGISAIVKVFEQGIRPFLFRPQDKSMQMSWISRNQSKRFNKKAIFANNTFFLLGAFIVAMVIFNLIDFFSEIRHTSVEELGNGVLLVTKSGEKYINYTLTESGFFGRRVEKTIVMKFDENLSMGLKELSRINNVMSNDTLTSELNENLTIEVNELNLNKNSKVLALWNNGHYIQAITGFDSLFYSPSSDYLFFSKDKRWDSEVLGKFSDSRKFRNFSNIIAHGSFSELWDFAKKNDCSYVFLSENDLYEFPYLFSYINGKYLNKKEDILLQGIKNSLLYALLLEKEFNVGCDNSKFDLIYSDSNSRIFRVC